MLQGDAGTTDPAVEYASAAKYYSLVREKTEDKPECREPLTLALTGLAKVAMAQSDPSRCVKLLEDCPVDEPEVVQLSGEAHAALGDLDVAQDALQHAIELWKQVGSGIHVQVGFPPPQNS